MKLQNYALGSWIEGDGEGTALYNAITGDQILQHQVKDWTSAQCSLMQEKSVVPAFVK